jgi:hypothetical protein
MDDQGRQNVPEDDMSKKVVIRVTLIIFLQEVLRCATAQPGLQAQVAPNPAVAPLNQYFIAAEASEIELARSAAPVSISHGAEVLVYRTFLEDCDNKSGVIRPS